MRVAIFARYSSRRQDEMSLEAQVQACEAFCAREGWTVVRRFLLAETRSADIEDSEEFQSMMAGAKRREFDLVLAHKLDRFGRHRIRTAAYKAAIRECGVQVRTVVENLGDSALDEAMEGLAEVFARLHQRNLGDETRKGQGQATKRGLWRGGSVPWGLVAVRLPGVTRGMDLQAHPTLGPVMVEVFERIARGDRSGDVLAWIEERTGERWARPALYARIRNEVYYGVIRYGKTRMRSGERRRENDPAEVVEGSWAGIVSEDLWRRANAQLDERGRGMRGKSYHKGRPLEPYLLTEGLASCSKCGRHLIGSRFKGTRHYCCSGRRDKACTSHKIRADLLESAFETATAGILRTVDVDRILADYQTSLEPQRKEAKTREASLRRALDQVRRKKRNLVARVEDGLDDPDILARLAELRKEEGQLAEEIATSQVETDQDCRLNVALVREYLKGYSELLSDATPEERRRLYRGLFRLTFDLETKEGQIHLNLAPSEVHPLKGWAKSGRSARTGFHPSPEVPFPFRIAS
jgi:site-specific DNA recombinase